MATAYLPRNCAIQGLANSLRDAGLLEQAKPAAVVHVADGGFIDVGAMAFLCAWAHGQVRRGGRIHLRGAVRPLGYLERMDLYKHVGAPHEERTRRTATGRFVPLQLVETDGDVVCVVNAICDIVLHQFDNGRAFLPALEWAVNEIIDNIIIHSETPSPGVVCAQYFPTKHRLDVGIADVGRGIKASLATTRDVRSHGVAVTTALRRGETRDPSIGQGNGMAGALEIAKLNGGAFEAWTGDVVYRLQSGRELGFIKIPTLPGTGVKLSLDTRRPVDLAQTWIAAGGWSFINSEAGRVAEAGGVDVADACLHTGSRPPARRLRNKLSALLPEMEEPLVLNFASVRSASSSFLDELLGRLAAELGPEEFGVRIRCIGMNPLIDKMANTVIAQRLGSLDAESESGGHGRSTATAEEMP